MYIMVLKLQNLREFHDSLFLRNGTTRISRSQLEIAIADRFGISPYVQRNIINSLIKFNFIRITDNNVVESVNMVELENQMVKSQ